jgi:hypothetical protein
VKVELILVIAVILLSVALIWVIYTTLSIRGAVHRTEERKGPSNNTKRLSAEVYIETFRHQKHKEKDKEY